MARYRVGLETRARILDAIRGLLADVGLEATTIKAICDRAGIGSGSFYNLFGSKEAAILEVVRTAIQAVDPDPDEAGSDTVEDLVEAYVDFITGSPELARIYVELAFSTTFADDTFVDRVRRHHRYRVHRFREAIVRASPQLGEGEAEAVAESLVASLTGFTVTWLLDPSFDLGGHARTLVRERVPA